MAKGNQKPVPHKLTEAETIVQQTLDNYLTALNVTKDYREDKLFGDTETYPALILHNTKRTNQTAEGRNKLKAMLDTAYLGIRLIPNANIIQLAKLSDLRTTRKFTAEPELQTYEKVILENREILLAFGKA
jgi:hypothetical protein